MVLTEKVLQMSNITLAGIGNIHTDADGRYSLNDFHKAAGALPHQKPSEWLSNQQTQELAEEIGKAGIPAYVSTRGGRNPGTYVCKELVYAYAMWISAPFQLKVIRAFDALVTGDIEKAQQIATPRTAPAKLFPDYFKVARLIGCDRNAAAISANQAVYKKTGENVLALLGQEAIEAEKQELVFNVSDLVDGISGQRMNKMLEDAGLQHNENGRWISDDGGEFSRVMDTGKRHGDGTPVQQLKWSRRVLSALSLEAA
jgi:hypothetical protein